ncbi:MAG: hypothetical protein JO263_06890 [Candidatus Eremiobacteraeota bacterium]|nr:hypothetical protein [Candidatus Eremiobacteraeota bacterium]
MRRPRLGFPTLVLAAGALVLLAAVAIGERMGDRVIGQATQQSLESVGPISVSASPDASAAPYGPDWKRSQALTAAGDPRFPDPRVPPQPLPTPAATPTPRPATPKPTATPIPNVPIWRQKPLPTFAPSAGPAGPETPAPSTSASQTPPAVVESPEP